jgi:SSS family solute:Na+ symporter
MTVNGWIFICLVGYAVSMSSVSLFWMRRIKKSTDLLVCGRGLPVWVLTGTMTAAAIGTGITVGASGLAYKSGWGGCVYPIGCGIGAILTGLFFAKMRDYKFITLSEEISCYYSRNKIVLEFVNISLLVAQLFWLAVQIMGAGFVLSVITGLSVTTSMIIGGAFVGIMSIPGGALTVVYTDMIQAIILLTGFVALTSVALINTGGLSNLEAKVPKAFLSFLGHESLGYAKIITIGLALMLQVIADAGRRMIMYSACSAQAAKISMVVSGSIVIIFSASVGIAGMYTYYLNPNIAAQDQALPWLVIHALPAWLGGLVVVAVAAAAYSSGATNGAAASSYFVRHIYPLIMGRYPKRPVIAIRCCLVGVFIIATLCAVFAGTIVDFVVSFLSLLLSGLSVIIILGRFWPRANWQGALAALISAFLVSALIMFVPWLNTRFGDMVIIPASVASLTAHFVVSLATPRKKLTFEQVAEMMTKERESIDEMQKEEEFVLQH